MARKLRLESEGGIYHVINRGNYRGDVFRSDRAKTAFLQCLGEACEKSGWVVHAWCVMSNHYHLALETPRGNLAEGMQWLQGTFARRYNSLRQESGHLFQGRYKSLAVESSGLGRCVIISISTRCVRRSARRRRSRNGRGRACLGYGSRSFGQNGIRLKLL